MIRAGVITKTIDESRKALARIEAKERRVLVRTGGFGRGTMRRIIPRRKKKSAVNQPPHAHAPGASGLKDVRYAVGDGEVVIGHIAYPRSRGTKSKTGVRRKVIASKPVPQLLNEGGPSKLLIDHPKRGKDQVPMNHRPRPFRDKAFDPTAKFFEERLANERL